MEIKKEQELQEQFYYLFKVNAENKNSNSPFADSSNFLEDVVSFITVELFDKTRVYQWFSSSATLGDLFEFVSSKLQPEMSNTTAKYNFYLQDKEIKNTNKYIICTKENQKNQLREFLSPINQGSTRNRYSLITRCNSSKLLKPMRIDYNDLHYKKDKTLDMRYKTSKAYVEAGGSIHGPEADEEEK